MPEEKKAKAPGLKRLEGHIKVKGRTYREMRRDLRKVDPKIRTELLALARKHATPQAPAQKPEPKPKAKE